MSKNTEGLLVLFSGLPSSGKSTVAFQLVHLISVRYKKAVYFVSLDKWRMDNYGQKAFYDEFINVMLAKLNLQLRSHILKGGLVILESGGYTAFPETKNIITAGIKNVCEVRLECPLFLAFFRDVVRSLRGKEPRTKFVYIKSVIRSIFGRRETVLFGFNKKLFEITGLYISTVQNSPAESAEAIASFINTTYSL